MAKEINYGMELQHFTDYVRSELNEDAKRHLLYPLFKKLYKDKFKIESNAFGADVYVEGYLLVEAKTNYTQWLDGFYQGLHYQRKFGLAYTTIMVVAHKFVGIWKVKGLPEHAIVYSQTADLTKSPSDTGKILSRKTTTALKKEIQAAAFYWLEPKDLDFDLSPNAKSLITESYQVLKILKNPESDRLQINSHNFIAAIERMKPFFAQPIEAVHAFYTIVAYWDITSTLSESEGGEIRLIGFKGSRMTDKIEGINPRMIPAFRKMVESEYIFTNEGSGLTPDYYFSRFDEVLAQIAPEYVKQHGIFFTHDALSKFAMWFIQHHFADTISNNYIVFDPAGGSGNLISSWRGKLRHKIISELQPDLLRTIERRVKIDPFHLETGFTIVPKTIENKGLNFLDRTADDYLAELRKALAVKNIPIDKPLAFLLNPPYKNTDENVTHREQTDSHYAIHPDILALTGEDAGKERYLAFLGQILLMAKSQTHTDLTGKTNNKPLVMIFTPTSWLIPRPTYIAFRQKWDTHFTYKAGFIITSNEWFKLDGKWPLAFTIWEYEPTPIDPLAEAPKPQAIPVADLTHLTPKDLAHIDWKSETADHALTQVLSQAKTVFLHNQRGDIRENLPLIERKGKMVQQTRVNLYRNVLQEEKGKTIISGFPLKDNRHTRIKDPYGFANGTFVGFMDDNTPLRIRQEPSNRFSNKPDRVWFYLDNRIQKVNLLKCFNGPADNRSFCAYDIDTAKALFSWFTIGKIIAGKYPLWTNMYDIWSPKLTPEWEQAWYAGCFAFVLAENRCIVTKFEANNPVAGAPEIWVGNPLCPTDSDSFWAQSLASYANAKPQTPTELSAATQAVIKKVTEIYRIWNMNYCHGQHIEAHNLAEEAYFRYFDYVPFLTPHSGLIQIRKYTDLEGLADMGSLFTELAANVKALKEALYSVLVGELGYFE